MEVEGERVGGERERERRGMVKKLLDSKEKTKKAPTPA